MATATRTKEEKIARAMQDLKGIFGTAENEAGCSAVFVMQTGESDSARSVKCFIATAKDQLLEITDPVAIISGNRIGKKGMIVGGTGFSVYGAAIEMVQEKFGNHIRVFKLL